MHFLVAVLSYSRRIFVKAFLHERQGEWLDWIASAFQRFGGVPAEVLGDNARCLVLGRDLAAQTVTFHPRTSRSAATGASNPGPASHTGLAPRARPSPA